MMKAYPVELRSKIIAAYKNNEGSMLKLACRFGVSRSFVQRIIKQEKTTGIVEPLGRQKNNSKLLIHTNLIRQLIKDNPEATLKDLCHILKEKTNVQVSQSTMCRFVNKINS